MIEALAKKADGVQLEYGPAFAGDYHRTIDQLDREQCALFEATMLVGRRPSRTLRT